MKQLSPTNTIQRQHLRVTGIVQGVGFRPFVYNLAKRLNLSGFVGNDNEGVFIEIEGDEENIALFTETLENNPPPLAHIESIVQTTIEPAATSEFIIVHSQQQAGSHTLVSPDLCICDDCLAELQNPTDRRYGYPFINCTNCGPRLTIIQDLPYDRPLTTMAQFPMCPDCEREYHDPTNRRFHAQPNACSVCGPKVWYQIGKNIAHDNAIEHVQDDLAHGKIVAVKGLGGFHLACDATNDKALKTLRKRKGRVDKPFAVMMCDMAMVRQYAEVNQEEENLLLSRERPIILLRKKEGTHLSELVTPNNHYVGVMLPYTPLHYLLIQDRPLVMTSANFSGEPLVKDNDEALQKLAALADSFLLHNRDIEIRCDDSVIRVLNKQELPVRRSRGYAPFPVKLPFEVKPILAVGGELKATFCVTNGQHALLSQHIGDMENLETLEAFEHTVKHYLRLFRVQPEIIVCDLHPRYLSTQWAQQYAEKHHIPLKKVQHHHAHIASVMVENGLGEDTTVLGFCFDGTGYGTDSTIWGGEVLLACYRDFQRLAYLKPIPLAGGDAAVKRPYRLALAHLWAAGITRYDGLACSNTVSEQEKRILVQQFERGLNTVPTSSMGRLFDAVASLLDIRQNVTYEAQAAIELEAIADETIHETPYCFGLIESTDSFVIDPKPVLEAIISDIRAYVPVAIISARFHIAVAEMILELSQYFREKTGINTIALSGGVFQNVRLLKESISRLEHNQFNVIHHHIVPPNDGGLALGQAIIGALL